MKTFRLALCLSLLGTLLAACGREPVQIPQGSYTSASAAESVEVGPTELRFRIQLEEREPRSSVDRTYPYQVQPGGRIHLVGMAEIHVETGIGQFDWFWDGKQITQTAARREGQPSKAFRTPDAWRTDRHKPFLDYLATPITDKQRLESARNEAAKAALEMVRACLQGHGECDDVFIDPVVARELRPWASKLAASSVTGVSENDDRKIAILFIDRPGESTVGIDFGASSAEPIRLRVGELIVD